MKYLCDNHHFAKAAGVVGILLIALMGYVAISFDFSDEERLLGLVVTGGVAGLLFLVASDLMRKTLKLQTRIIKLEEQIARLTPPVL